jgi:hypothetical protein
VFKPVTGVMNIQYFYAWPFRLYRAHCYGAGVFIAAFVVHMAFRLLWPTERPPTAPDRRQRREPSGLRSPARRRRRRLNPSKAYSATPGSSLKQRVGPDTGELSLVHSPRDDLARPIQTAVPVGSALFALLGGARLLATIGGPRRGLYLTPLGRGGSGKGL